MSICKNLSLKLLIPISLLLCLLLTSCSTATRSGTMKQLDSKTLTGIKKFGIFVKKMGEFKVMSASERHSGWGGIGESIARYGADTRSASEMIPMLGDFDPKTYIREKLYDFLSHSKPVNELVSIETINPSVIKEKQIDTTLEVIIEVWGLRRGLDPTVSKSSAVFDIKAKMVKTSTGEIIWVFNYLYLDSQQYSQENFLSQPELLKKVMTQSANRVSERIFNEIRYSQY